MTGVPRVDLDALEHGRLELLHVEQAAVVGLWRYAELVGLEPAALVPVLRNHWPRPALAVDALHGEPGGLGTPCARLDAAEAVLTRITSRGRELTTGRASPLGLSAATKDQLAECAAGTVLTVALVGPANRPSTAPSRKAGASRPARRAVGAAIATGPVATGPVASGPVASGPVGEISVELAGETPPRAAAGGPAPEPRDKGRRWTSHVAHAVAERFGLDEGRDDGAPVVAATGGPGAPGDGAGPEPAPVAGRLWDDATTRSEPVENAPDGPGTEPSGGPGEG